MSDGGELSVFLPVLVAAAGVVVVTINIIIGILAKQFMGK